MADSTPTSIIMPHLDHFLKSRDPPKTLCPSEVARRLSPADLSTLSAASWRETMPLIRRVVAEMRESGEVEVLQRGQVLEGDLGEGLEGVRGPIRLRRTEATTVMEA